MTLDVIAAGTGNIVASGCEAGKPGVRALLDMMVEGNHSLGGQSVASGQDPKIQAMQNAITQFSNGRGGR